MRPPKEAIDPQTIRVRCATHDGVPYALAEPTGTGVEDGVADLVFVVERGCEITLLGVEPLDNCRIVRQEVRDGGQVMRVDLGYDLRTKGDARTSLTYALWYRDADGVERQAYGGEPTEAVTAARGATPHPPPKILFP